MELTKFEFPCAYVVSYVDRLEECDLLKVGAFVSAEMVERIIDRPFTEVGWSFRGPFLEFKAQIESKGFFITQRGVEPKPAFRILNTREMAHEGKLRLFRAMATNYKVSHVMATHQGERLSQKEQKQYDSVQDRAANVALMQQNILLKNTLFSSIS